MPYLLSIATVRVPALVLAFYLLVWCLPLNVSPAFMSSCTRSRPEIVVILTRFTALARPVVGSWPATLRLAWMAGIRVIFLALMSLSVSFPFRPLSRLSQCFFSVIALVPSFVPASLRPPVLLLSCLTPFFGYLSIHICIPISMSLASILVAPISMFAPAMLIVLLRAFLDIVWFALILDLRALMLDFLLRLFWIFLIWYTLNIADCFFRLEPIFYVFWRIIQWFLGRYRLLNTISPEAFWAIEVRTVGLNFVNLVGILLLIYLVSGCLDTYCKQTFFCEEVSLMFLILFAIILGLVIATALLLITRRVLAVLITWLDLEYFELRLSFQLLALRLLDQLFDRCTEVALLLDDGKDAGFFPQLVSADAQALVVVIGWVIDLKAWNAAA